MAVAVSWLSLPLHGLWMMAANPPDETVLIQALREVPGPVLTENHGLAVMLAGKEPIAGDPIGIASISITGRWDPTPLNEMIRAQTFSLIVLQAPVELVPDYQGFPWWPPGTLETIAEQYQPSGRLGDHFLYIPTQPAAPAPVTAAPR